jgi:replication initiation and membrane attachment protein DnaB
MQKLINHQIHNATEAQILQYANKYSITLSNKEAQAIVAILNNNKVDIFDTKERLNILKKIARNVNPNVAKKMNNILERILN